MTTGIDSDPVNLEIRKTAVIAGELSRSNIDDYAPSETRLPELGTIRENDYTFYWISLPAVMRRAHGVGFAICMDTAHEISERLITLLSIYRTYRSCHCCLCPNIGLLR